MEKLGQQNQTGSYSLFVDTGANKLTLAGETLFECLGQIQKQYFKGKTVLRAARGDLKSEIYLYPPRMNRLVANKIYRLLVEKRMESMLT